MRPRAQWVETHVTEDKAPRGCNAVSEELIREDARSGGFPAGRISRVLA